MGKLSNFKSPKVTPSSRIGQLLTLLVASSVLLGVVAIDASAAQNPRLPGTVQLDRGILSSLAASSTPIASAVSAAISASLPSSTSSSSKSNSGSEFLGGALSSTKSTNIPWTGTDTAAKVAEKLRGGRRPTRNPKPITTTTTTTTTTLPFGLKPTPTTTTTTIPTPTTTTTLPFFSTTTTIPIFTTTTTSPTTTTTRPPTTTTTTPTTTTSRPPTTTTTQAPPTTTTTPAQTTPFPLGVPDSSQVSGYGPPAADALAGYSRDYMTNFPGSSLPAGWSAYSGTPGGDPGGQFGLAHAVVGGGMLSLDTWQDPAFNNEWVTGGVCDCGVAPTYGAFFVRSRMTGSGPTSVAMLYPNSGWPPEVDFYETYGGTSQSMATIHWGSSNSQYHSYENIDLTKWHTWGVIWTATTIKYTVDGQVFDTVTTSDAQIPNVPMHLALQQQTWCSASWACPTAPQSYQINWVEIYTPS